MSERSATHGASWDGEALRLDRIGGALAVCSADGVLLGASLPARALLGRFGVSLDSLPVPLPAALWAALARTPHGEATDWVPTDHPEGLCLGCTPYAVDGGLVLLLMREVSERQRALAQRLHKQRLESMGRVVASMAHDIRTFLAPIVFNGEALLATSDTRWHEDERDALREMLAATEGLRRLVDGILDFARVGPPVLEAVSLAEVFSRASGLLRSLLRDGRHTLDVDLTPDAVWVRGNRMVIEQAVVNLLSNAFEGAPQGGVVGATSTVEEVGGPRMVRLVISDDGPGVPEGLRKNLFQPFFTTKPGGTGLGLAATRDAVRDLGGDVVLEPSDVGASFAILLPAVTGEVE